MKYVAVCFAVAVTVSAAFAAQENVVCLVDGKTVSDTEKAPRRLVQGKPVRFCSVECSKRFEARPEPFAKSVLNCPVLGSKVEAPNAMERAVINNGLWYFCCPSCTEMARTNGELLKGLIDVVSGKRFDANSDSPTSEWKGQFYFFETEAGKTAFNKMPAKYAVVYGK